MRYIANEWNAIGRVFSSPFSGGQLKTAAGAVGCRQDIDMNSPINMTYCSFLHPLLSGGDGAIPILHFLIIHLFHLSSRILCSVDSIPRRCVGCEGWVCPQHGSVSLSFSLFYFWSATKKLFSPYAPTTAEARRMASSRLQTYLLPTSTQWQ